MSCPRDKITNPATKRCVNRDGPIGRKLLGTARGYAAGGVKVVRPAGAMNSKGRVIMYGPRGGAYVMVNGKKRAPAVGRRAKSPAPAKSPRRQRTPALRRSSRIAAAAGVPLPSQNVFYNAVPSQSNRMAAALAAPLPKRASPKRASPARGWRFNPWA